jgi:hypothetical protein
MDLSTQVSVCQAPMGSCGYVLSCQTLKVAASQGLSSKSTYPVLENPQVWLPRARACAEPGLEDKANWADRW